MPAAAEVPTVNVSVPTDAIHQLIAEAAGEVGTSRGTDPGEQSPVRVVTTVDVPAESVTVPVAFDLPAASCCNDRFCFFTSVSLMSGT